MFGSFTILGKMVSGLFLYRFLTQDLGGNLSLFPPINTSEEHGDLSGSNSKTAAVLVSQVPSYTATSGGYQDSYQAS